MEWVAGAGSTLKALPRRLKVRSVIELPRCTKSSTAKLLPQRAKLRRLSALPRCKQSSTARLLPGPATQLYALY